MKEKKMELSQEIINAKKVLNQIEMLNANPDINGKKLIYDAVLDLENIVRNMIFRTVNYKDNP